MRYSVVIPLYNKEHYIEQTLRSVLNQTCQDFEIVLVDDGSKDNSLAAAARVQSDKIRIIRQEKLNEAAESLHLTTDVLYAPYLT
jgi:glycosyltransferase involved in cell wall biosynthesis